LRIYIFFFLKHRYFLSFNNPTTFSEKIQLRKLSLSQSEADLADKFKVREYVEQIIGKNYLIPLIGVFDELSTDTLTNLPLNSVIKTNHGSGVNHIHFFNENSNINEVLGQFTQSLKEDYKGALLGETHYSLIDRKIIVEELLDFGSDSPPDFKFHIFNNKGAITWFLQVDFDRFINHRRNYYDSDLMLLNLRVIYDNGHFELPNKSKISQMADLAIKLNNQYTYSRIDLYLHADNVFFGEITLTPGSGFERFSSKELDKSFGVLWSDFNK
jgi:hypothetical protein